MNDTQLLNWDEDELLVEIGKAAAEIRAPMRPPTREELREIGARWVQRNMAALREAVCSDSHIREMFTSGRKELLFELVCEVIVHVTAGLPAGCVAAFLVKQGVERLCHEND
jgi:hypothetical protein